MRFGIFIYDGVEPIDLATFGVLSMARRVAPAIEITTIAPRAGVVTLANGLQAIAVHGVDAPPPVDVVIVTGGPGWPQQVVHEPTLAYLREAARHAVIAGQEVPPIALLRERHPRVEVVEARVVDNGRVVTGGGVTLCIDATLHLIARLLGRHVADETARILEYRHAWEANRLAFATVQAPSA